MKTLYPGARQLPVRHLSIRVPWHDTGWDGRVCHKPSENASCLILKRIRENRDDSAENATAGQYWQDLPYDRRPACVAERAGFLSPKEICYPITHPYVERSNAHQHFDETKLRQPPFSANCVPYYWMLKKTAPEFITNLQLGYQQDLEDQADKAIGFQTGWLQTRHNQLVMLDTFFSAIRPLESLCFFYAKQTPLSDSSKRVIVGVGRVQHIGNSMEWNYSSVGPHRAMVWERNIGHSIRPGTFQDGFLFPYHEILQAAQANSSIDPDQFVAFAPDDHFREFSYGTEHVTHDGAIASLLACAKAIGNIGKVIPGNFQDILKWIDIELNRLWKMRGPFPGMGSALSAFGISHGNLIAYDISRMQSESNSEWNQDPWPYFEQALLKPDLLGKDVQQFLQPTHAKMWNSITDERKALLRLLSRFELTTEQATRYYQKTEREKAHITISDRELLQNPYLIYELDRDQPDTIPLGTIDRGLFPDAIVREKHPIPEPSQIEGDVDPRRVRAFVTDELERAALVGHTLLPANEIIQNVRDLNVEPKCPLSEDLLSVAEAQFAPLVKKIQLSEGMVAFQLEKMGNAGNVIRKSVLRRLQGNRHESTHNWRQLLDDELGNSQIQMDELENLARQEKVAALEELFASRVSVLLGPAGTGKTTLLKVFCMVPEIRNRGILLLAPTGKARVRLETQTGIPGAKTLAQLLVQQDRYDPRTGKYRTSNRDKIGSWETVIIDEASMLTEEQLAAAIDALKPPQRLILVGDTAQLPPIGAGRPFVDIVNKLRPGGIENKFPKIDSGYAELTIRRRQIGIGRDDLMLAEWFSGRPVDPGGDEIWDRIKSLQSTEYLKLIPWQSDEELQEKLIDCLIHELNLEGKSDEKGFEISLGGIQSGQFVYFNNAYNGKPGSAEKVENWQILSPVRGQPYGVDLLNRLIQKTFRRNTIQLARNKWRKVPKPFGHEEIIYGDKVINILNQHRKDVWPKENALCYVANGEIGIAVGQFKSKNANYSKLPWKLEVEFASQLGFKYGYEARDFGEENEAKLSLAYALTIHKAQGSEFGLTFLIIPNPCFLLSRELLYTAFTRQQDKLIVFHQGNLGDLFKYSSIKHAEIPGRLTNLFKVPKLRIYDDRRIDEGFIHLSRAGIPMRSKSEIIIADLLHSKGIDFEYERQFVGTDGKIRYPDFTIDDAESGLKIYWEHLGMLRDPVYRDRWLRKLDWYKTQNVKPMDEGGGDGGVLVTTEDDKHGGINSAEIELLIDTIFSV